MIGIDDGNVNVDDIVETTNHFRCIDIASDKISESFIKELHLILKNGTSDSKKEWSAVGGYKKLPNVVGGKETVLPENVANEIKKLIASYNKKTIITFEDIVEFHHKFESIHPFQDGNGRVGRLIIFKECLKHNIVPFAINEHLKMYRYRGLSEFEKKRVFLIDTCLVAEDKFKKYLEYFRIEYK